MLSVHWFATALIFAELTAGCCQVLVPPPSTEQPFSPSTALAGEVTFLHSDKSEGKARKGKTNSCCYSPAQEA